MYENSSRNYHKNEEKSVPSKPGDFRNLLKITHVRGAKQGTKNNKLLVLGGFLLEARVIC